MSLKIDPKRSLSEINFKLKNERKGLASSINNIASKKSVKKMSLTPIKNNILNEKDNKVTEDKRSNDIKKSLKFSYNINPFIKKNAVKKNEILIHDDTAFSSKKSENNNSIPIPKSHRIHDKDNYFPVDVNISDLANFSIDKLKKMSDNLMKKTLSSNNLSSYTHREKKTDKSSENVSVASSKNKISTILNSNRYKNSINQLPGKKTEDKENKEKDKFERNSKSNNNLLKANEEINKRFV